MKRVILYPPKIPIQKSISLSGSKSISNRILLLKAILGLNFIIHNLSSSEDSVILQKALKQITLSDSSVIDVNHAGTDMRFLTAFLATQPGKWTLTGSERMKERPIGELVGALQQIGADIRFGEKQNYPPLLVVGKKLKGGAIEIDAGISSQFISALLLISPLLSSELILTLKNKAVSQPYTQMTIDLLKEFGVNIYVNASQIIVSPLKSVILNPSKFVVESDWSSASYWYSICALSPGSKIELSTLHQTSTQADAILPQLFDPLGVKSSFRNGKLLLEHQVKKATTFEFDFTNCPDIAPTIACCCFALHISAQLHGLHTLQFKESKRIDVLNQELQKLGAISECTPSSLFVAKSDQVHSTNAFNISTYHDHRMALSFAPLAYRFPGLCIEDPDVIQKSYPAFWDDLQSVGFSLNLQTK